MKRTRLKIKTTREFFERGRRIAQAADQGLPLTEPYLLALGDSASLKNLRSKRKRKSKILEAVHESAKDLHRIGFIDDESMKRYDELCL